MEEIRVSASEVERAPDVIRKAKYEVGRTDILICGKCHMAFYHIEEFQEHRSEDKCTQDSILRDNEKMDPKEQVWAFTLWKNGVLNTGKRTEPLTTWTLYKRWCALSESEKEAWIIAGQNLQTFTKLSLSRMHEIKGRTSMANKKMKSNSTLLPEKINTASLQNNDSLEEGEVRLSQLTEAQRAAVKAQIAANKSNKENTSEIKKVPVKLAQLYADLITKPADLRKALRTSSNNTIEEAVFEKVLSRRFNHKNKCLEYFVKWENMKESENTWEPKGHFDKCKQIMEEFDKVFNTSKIIPKTIDSQPESENETPTRPARSSKQKAKDQVKTWCDNMSEDEEQSSKKRLFDDDSDSTDSFEKKIKMEEDTDTSDDERPMKKSKISSSLNGIPKKSVDGITPQRIVRVSQKHLPNLSTGVYIMSKTEGIIKLNSDTPLPSNSPLLKVGQKIGQTHVKMIKKDTTKSPVKILPKQPKLDSSIGQQTGVPGSKGTPLSIKHTEASEKPVDEDSDGLSELEFPTDLPLPEPESPPGDFILDPLTGKIAGQEYEEENKDDSELKSDSDTGVDPEPEVTSLDTLVKMAVSDLPDVDDMVNDDIKMSIVAKVENLANETLSTDCDTPPAIILDSPPVNIKSESTSVSKTDFGPVASTSKKIAATEIDLESAITLTAIEKTPPPVKPKFRSETNTSILNAALTTSKVGTKKLLSTTPNTVRQKVIPHSQMHMPSPSRTIIHKIPNRPRSFTSQTQLPDQIVKRSPNVNTYKPASAITRRIGSTTIYKTSSKPKQSQPILRAQSTYKQQPIVSKINASSSPVASISMPLIGIDDEPEAIPSTSSAIAEPSDSDLLQTLSSELPTINLTDTETPLFITGEDGTIYQVAGQNEEGQTILISEGPDGQQQCVIVSTDPTAEEEPSQPLLIGAPDPPAPLPQQPQHLEDAKMDIEEPEGDTSDDSQVVAQIVKADPPSPGGTRKVVLMLPDGNLMMTDVTAEQYAALELDK